MDSSDDDGWSDLGEECEKDAPADPHVAGWAGQEAADELLPKINGIIAHVSAGFEINDAARLALAAGHMGAARPGRVVEFTLHDLYSTGVMRHGVTPKMLVDEGAVDAVVAANLMQPVEKKNWRKKIVPRSRSEWHKCQFKYTGRSETFLAAYNGLRTSWTPTKKKKGWFSARASTM
jgi:hypothetical protein